MASGGFRFGVVVLNWNGRDFLDDCLSSVLASDHPDFFVLLVDNASTDGSVEWVQGAFEGVEVLALPRNLRFAGGNNAGIERALQRGADAIVLLNNDTRVDPGWLRALAEVLAAEEGVGVVGPRICYFDEPELIWYGGGRFIRPLGWVFHRALRRRVDERADPAGPTDWVSGCALAARAEVWRRLGGLDESYYIYAEDVDFCLRARRMGVEIRYQPAALVLHKVSASVGGAVSAFKAYHKSRAGLHLLRRHLRVWELPGALAGRAVHDGAVALRLLAGGHGGAAAAVLRAWVDAARGRVGFPVGEDGP